MSITWKDASDPRYATTSIVLGGGRRTAPKPPTDADTAMGKADDGASETPDPRNHPRVSGGSDFYEEPEAKNP